MSINVTMCAVSVILRNNEDVQHMSVININRSVTKGNTTDNVATRNTYGSP